MNPSINPYNPLDLEALGDSLLRELERREPYPLSAVPSFAGSGVYALYYLGGAPQYETMGRFNREYDCALPIYIGRAKDPGSRSGRSPFAPVTSRLLCARIAEHARSIAAGDGIDVNDFKVRALVSMPIWIPLAEAMAIRRFRPLWNSHLEGFGIHAPGRGRAGQERSEWDELHPGRSFAGDLKGNARSRAVLLEAVQAACREAVRLRAAELAHTPEWL